MSKRWPFGEKVAQVVLGVLCLIIFLFITLTLLGGDGAIGVLAVVMCVFVIRWVIRMIKK